MNHPFSLTRQLIPALRIFMRKFLIIFRKILFLCNFHRLFQISILRALQSKWFSPSTSWILRYVFEARSSIPQFSSRLFLPVPLPLSRRDIPPPSSLPLCQPHPLGCDVSISGPVQQMMSCNWVAASRGSLGSCAEGLFLLSNLSTSLIRKVGVIQAVPYSATNFLFSRNTWFLSSVYNIGNLFIFSFIFISWRLINLQYCSGFCRTLTWISHGFTCVHWVTVMVNFSTCVIFVLATSKWDTFCYSYLWRLRQKGTFPRIHKQ